MTRALVIGASGQDGSYLTGALLARGYEVHVTSRAETITSESGLIKLGTIDAVRVHKLDAEDAAAVCDLFKRINPDLVFNLGGQSSVGRSFAAPTETFRSIAYATANLLEAVRLITPRARFYSAGSSECFGDCGGVPATTETPLRPLSPYAAAKSAAAMLVKTYRESYGLYCVTGYLFNHESRFRPERFVTSKIIRAAVRISRGSNETLTLGDISVQRDWGWAPEFVEAMMAMLEQQSPVDHVVATGHIMSIEQFVGYAFDAFGLDWREHVVFDLALARPNELKASVGDPFVAQRELGWRAQTYGRALVDKLCMEVAEDMK